MKFRPCPNPLEQITDWQRRSRLAGYRVKNIAESCHTNLRQFERDFKARMRQRRSAG